MCSSDAAAARAGSADPTSASVVSSMTAAVIELSTGASRERLHRMSPDDRAALLVALQRLTDATALATATATEVFDAHGDGELLAGARSTQSWIRHVCRVSGAEASQRVRVARAREHRLGDAWTAVVEGAMTYEHLRAIERATRRVPSEHHEAAVDVLATLAEQATVDDVRVAGRHLLLAVDPDGSLGEAHRQFERRHLMLSPMLDGMTGVDGLLDPETAEQLQTALRPFLTPLGATDTRSAAQRRADGLGELIASAVAHQSCGTAGAPRPHLSVVVDGAGAAMAGSGEPLHPLTVDRLACDARFTPMFTDASGIVTDLGRTQRLFSGVQRALLAARDGGCRWPGCHRSPSHTDAHHLVPWQKAGRTDVTNGLLLCRFHHRLLHEGGWTAAVVDQALGSTGAVRLVAPHGAVLVSHPRGPLPFSGHRSGSPRDGPSRGP